MGKFIVFEGIDGSGKTTQLKLLSEYFSSHNIPHIVTKEPTDGPIGRLARSVVRGAEPLSEEALSLLFSADRLEHISNEIRPALEAGKYVLCDRYVFSNIAYQGYQPVGKPNRLAPDLTVFIDTNPEECTRRILVNRPAMEIYDGLENAKNIRNNYLKAFQQYKNIPVKVVDGNRPKQEVFVQLLELPLICQVCQVCQNIV